MWGSLLCWCVCVRVRVLAVRVRAGAGVVNVLAGREAPFVKEREKPRRCFVFFFSLPSGHFPFIPPPPSKPKLSRVPPVRGLAAHPASSPLSLAASRALSFVLEVHTNRCARGGGGHTHRGMRAGAALAPLWAGGHRSRLGRRRFGLARPHWRAGRGWKCRQLTSGAPLRGVRVGGRVDRVAQARPVGSFTRPARPPARARARARGRESTHLSSPLLHSFTPPPPPPPLSPSPHAHTEPTTNAHHPHGRPRRGCRPTGPGRWRER